MEEDKAPLLGRLGLLGGSRKKARKGRAPVERSPFFAPRATKVRSVETPGGTFVKNEKVQPDGAVKSSIMGASANLINAIVGAGIVGIPYAIRECGLVTGVGLVLFCALLTEKSLRLLIETARHVNVPSYEMLLEASFGTIGFYFISINMFIMAYGAMLTYLMIVKQTLPVLLGVAVDNYPMNNAILTVSSLLVQLPLSCQRDMAQLAKTSRISVVLDCFIVMIIAIFSPFQNAVEEQGGINEVLSRSIVHPTTVFVGLGVLSFAFVCQHSAFIIAGSLEQPSKKRWSKVTSRALCICAFLASICGITGYLGFMEATEGNILNNFVGDESFHFAANVARGLLCSTMFLVYPMESFVTRHVCVVLLFQGRRAHEGEDHSILDRKDRRIALTTGLYILALVPALLLQDVGSVLAFTGAIAGSCLSYIGPGVAYLAVHGNEFLELVETSWGFKLAPSVDRGQAKFAPLRGDIEVANTGVEIESAVSDTPETGYLMMVLKTVAWYILWMPFWCSVATFGKKTLMAFSQAESIKSPHPNPLGNVLHNRLSTDMGSKAGASGSLDGIKHSTSEGNLAAAAVIHKVASGNDAKTLPKKNITVSGYGAVEGAGGNRGIAAAIAAKNKQAAKPSSWQVDVEEDPQHDPPTTYDFLIAIGFILFGVVALSA
eukprot:CAMPEP_0198290222 /NCGR_PEP_ID=MMETSP1449-20131203/8170_1 /TAXON_ID=420275 /ORGANISM="Attheya septentrionalis, Strain CCMP2084" /LENGTH=660 /DNA_ID=CAMNT_0043988699 /DNA_START=42 /DNA_END=2021 /DNA_ORIENTATION=-